MHLSQLKRENRKAYEAYVEMLVEDCQDDFNVDDDGVLTAASKVVIPDPDHPGTLTMKCFRKMVWDPDGPVTMDVGAPWREE